MSVRSLVLVFTSIVDTMPILSGVGVFADPIGPPKLSTKPVLPSGVIAIWIGPGPTGMSVGSLVLVFRSTVDTELLPLLTTKPVLPSGVNAPPSGPVPAAMSGGLWVLVFTSIAEIVSLRKFVV